MFQLSLSTSLSTVTTPGVGPFPALSGDFSAALGDLLSGIPRDAASAGGKAASTGTKRQHGAESGKTLPATGKPDDKPANPAFAWLAPGAPMPAPIAAGDQAPTRSARPAVTAAATDASIPTVARPVTTAGGAGLPVADPQLETTAVPATSDGGIAVDTATTLPDQGEPTTRAKAGLQPAAPQPAIAASISPASDAPASASAPSTNTDPAIERVADIATPRASRAPVDPATPILLPRPIRASMPATVDSNSISPTQGEGAGATAGRASTNRPEPIVLRSAPTTQGSPRAAAPVTALRDSIVKTDRPGAAQDGGSLPAATPAAPAWRSTAGTADPTVAASGQPIPATTSVGATAAAPLTKSVSLTPPTDLRTPGQVVAATIPSAPQPSLPADAVTAPVTPASLAPLPDGSLTESPARPAATPIAHSVTTQPADLSSSIARSGDRADRSQAAPPVFTAATPAPPTAPTVQQAGMLFGFALANPLADRRNAPTNTGSPRDQALQALTAVAGTTQTLAAVAPAGQAQHDSLDMSRDDWPQAMIDRIEALRDAADATDTRIRLVPDALGKVDVSLHHDGGTVHVHFAAEQPATRALIADAQPRLADAAQQRGLRLGQTTVDAGTTGNGQQQQQAATPQTPIPAAPPPVPGSARPLPGADIDPTDPTRLA